MKELALAAVAALAFACSAAAQTYHQASEGTVDFAKAAFADSSDPANWDMITDTVAITRANVQGIYNPFAEGGYINSFSPEGTLWYFGGSVQDVIDGALTIGDFDVWQDAHSSSPPSTVGVDSVLYLLDDATYVDIRFTSWGVGGGSGGSFSYTRAIVPTPGSAVILCGSMMVAARRRR
jgi:hypothetical protein